MSKWCGKCDFRDTLSINFNDDFSDFITATNGTIYQRKGKEVVEVKIEKPSDLIPFYAHLIAIMGRDPDHTYIQLAEESYLDTRIKEIKEFNELYPHCRHSDRYYKVRRAKLTALYEKERKKPIAEQDIVDE